MEPNRSTQHSVKPLSVEPGREVAFHVTGNFFLVLDCNIEFILVFNRGERFECGVGLGYIFQPGDFFTSFRVQNPSTDTVLTGALLTGSALALDARQNVFKASPKVEMVAEGPTFVVPSGVTSLGAGESHTLTGAAVIVT